MPTATHELIHYQQTDGVVQLQLQRPQQFNALSAELIQALHQQLDTLQHDSQVRCVVLSGAGKAFCAGHDLKQMRDHYQLEYYQQLFNDCAQLMQRLQQLPVPVIAKVQGIATAAGCQLIASCDLVIASTEAKFAVSGINAGLFCSSPAVALSRNLSTKRAFDLLVTGRFIDAITAADWGLINAAVDPADLDQAVAEKVATIIEKSPTAIRYGKRLFYQQLAMPQAEAYAHAAEIMAQNMMEADALEGVTAFIEKRAPQWPSLSE